MEKLTLKELKERKDWKTAVVVISQDSFNKPYTENERSYKVKSSAKYFDPSMIGNSLFADSLDGIDTGIRLDNYISAGWKVEYCYIPIEMELINYFDVWAGDSEEGEGPTWTVNNLCSEGNIFVKSYENEDVLQALKNAKFIKEETRLENLYIDHPGDDRIEIEQASDYMPIFALRDIV